MVRVHELRDPFGNKVILDEALCGLEANRMLTEDLYDAVTDVITRPTMMFKTTDKLIRQFYFRAIGWHTSLIIGVTKRNDEYEAYECIKNPSFEMFGTLLKHGERLI